MKRITWWPQAWLGMVFTWGAPVAWVALRSDHWEVLAALYAGSILWCVGYDTIYALQDREDDALAGIKSSARALGRNVKAGVMGFYAVAILCWAGAVWQVRPDAFALAALLPVSAHLLWQALTLRSDDGDDALAKFRSNRFAGLLMAAACLVVGSTA
jgi:4-hydroxybenzoate polyprenyltransferase